MNFYKSGDFNYIDKEEINLIVLKNQFFNITELKMNDSIINSITQLNNNYKSILNSKNLENLRECIYQKILIMQKNHDNNIKVLMKSQEKYLLASQNASNMLDIR